MYNFSNSWFLESEIRSDILLHTDPADEHHILEIGSFEGASACFFSDHLLSHPKSSLTCVDPFDLGDNTTPVVSTTQNDFLRNIHLSKNCQKIAFHQTYSYNLYITNNLTFDIIYIDGSHLLNDITTDFENCLSIVKHKGIIWMDDYLGGADNVIKNHIDKLAKLHSRELEILHKGYQIAFRKRLDLNK